MKILLLNPPFLDKFSKSSRSPGVTKSATIYFPLWLSYAAGVLDKEGYELKGSAIINNAAPSYITTQNDASFVEVDNNVNVNIRNNSTDSTAFAIIKE